MLPATLPEGPEVEIRLMRLEMERPESLVPPAGKGDSVALLPMTNPPLHFYRYLVDRIGREWHWTTYLCFGDAELTERIHGERRDMRLLLVDGSPAGFFDLDRKADRVTELVYFGLLPHVVGRGLGKWLLSQAIHAAFSAGAERLVLYTCSLDHPAALGVYQSAGFRIVEEELTPLKLLSDTQRAAILFRP